MNKYKETILTSNFHGLLASFKLVGDDCCTVLKNNDSNKLSFVSELERNSYTSFARKNNLSIDEFFHSYERVVNFNSSKIFLGSSSFVNICELYRKTGLKIDLSTINENDFNNLFNKYLKEVELFLQRGESLQYQLYALSKRHYQIFNFIRPLVDAYTSNEDIKEMLLNNSQIMAGRVYSSKVSEVEVIYYILNLIGDYFRVDSVKLNSYLCFMLKSSNRCLYISDEIRGHRDSLVTDELVINPKKIFVYDQNIELNFLSEKLTTYNSLTISADLLSTNTYYSHKIFYMNNSDSFGSSCPHIEVVFNENKVFLKYFYKKERASKETFYISKAQEILLSSLAVWDLKHCTSSIETHKSENLYCNREGYISNKVRVDSISSDEFDTSRYLNYTSSSNMYMGNSYLLSKLLAI